jgi:hypothetical protein
MDALPVFADELAQAVRRRRRAGLHWLVASIAWSNGGRADIDGIVDPGNWTTW